ncbi:hypothetical protein EDD21DRAFT_191788 [Dissophora ornata]|nr:hypothetical protein EDD21DRAFT_191788 [Dissophora ornata]
MMARGSSASHSLATGHASSARHSSSSSGGSWLDARGPSQGSAGGPASLSGQLRLPTTIRIPLVPARPAKPSKAPLRIPVTTSRELTGLKIRIPRNLPNLPEVFRKRGAIRSQSSLTASPSGSEGKATPRSGPDSFKRTHSTMMMGDDEGLAEYMSYALESNGPRIKIVRRQPPALGLIPSHLATAKNLAIRTVQDPSSDSPSTSSRANVSVATAPEKAGTTHTLPVITASMQGLKSQSKSKSKSSSPISTPAHPASETTAQATAAGSGSLPGSVVDANMRSESEEHSPSLGTSASGAWASSDFALDSLKAIGLVRVGMGILDELLSNTFSKSFLNKVPLSMTNYHVKIKKPMDLATIELKLWKTLEIAGADSGAPETLVKAAESLAMGVSEGYTNLQEFERDLRKIYQNATLFNSPTHIIYKEAQSFQASYVNLLTSYRQG